MSAVLAEVVRSGFVESLHHGSAIALGPPTGGRESQQIFALGDVDAPVFPRSTNKPMQAVGMLRCGLSLEPADLALAAASHSGEQVHVQRVRDMLGSAGLTDEALRCPPGLPLSEAAAEAALRTGAGPSRLQMNCSGKHAAMLLTCLAAGWPIEDYVAPDHPLQRELRAAVEELTGDTVTAVGVDGCSAPVFAVSLRGVARAFGRLVTAEAGTHERQVADAMRSHPELVGGTGRDVTALMAGVPGLLAKDGAEGVYAAALPNGASVALKIDDGSARARTPVLVRELRRLGADGDVLAELSEVPVLGGGEPVGCVRVAY
ncbi:MAG: asparaginase [Mycobacteriales bacterium]